MRLISFMANRLYIYLYPNFSHMILKDKTKLTHQFCHLFQFLQLFCFTHLGLFIYISEVR